MFLLQRLGKTALNKKEYTFVVKVLYQQHNTWQGTVFWVEGYENRRFRSVFELMRLIGGVIGDSRLEFFKKGDEDIHANDEIAESSAVEYDERGEVLEVARSQV